MGASVRKNSSVKPHIQSRSKTENHRFPSDSGARASPRPTRMARTAGSGGLRTGCMDPARWCLIWTLTACTPSESEAAGTPCSAPTAPRSPSTHPLHPVRHFGFYVPCSLVKHKWRKVCLEPIWICFSFWKGGECCNNSYVGSINTSCVWLLLVPSVLISLPNVNYVVGLAPDCGTVLSLGLFWPRQQLNFCPLHFSECLFKHWSRF